MYKFNSTLASNYLKASHQNTYKNIAKSKNKILIFSNK